MQPFFISWINSETINENYMKDKVILSLIPHFSTYAVSTEGNLYRVTKNGSYKQLSNNVNYNGYVINRIVGDDKKLHQV